MERTRETFYEFDGFSLDARARVLYRDSQIVDLTPKALDILLVLVENAGDVVSKEDLLARVWADSFVEEANLSHHIFKLRRALGERDGRKLIETVPRRGYRFIESVRPAKASDSSPLPSTTRKSAQPASTEGRSGRAPVLVPNSRFRRSWLWLAAGMLVAAALAGAWWAYDRSRQQIPAPAGSQGIRSIAVLPFVNESGSDDVEYLADGMTETLIQSLTEIPSIGVKPRTAVAAYKGKNVPAATVASDLNVQVILFGRLTQRNNNITIFLSLIDPATDYQIWGKQYNRTLSDLSALQGEIGRDVADSLEARFAGADGSPAKKKYSENAEAYRLYLLGDFYWAKFTQENFWKAKEQYERAIALDPTYALAYTGISNTYSVLGANGHIPMNEGREKSRAAAVRALELDDHLAEAHLTMGAYKMFFEWDLNGAEIEFKKAMELDPTYAVPHELQAYRLRSQLRFDEAIAESKRSVELDPTNLLMVGDLGTCYRFAGRLDDARAANQRVMDMDSRFPDVYFEDALTYSQLGDHESAIKQMKKSLELGSVGGKYEAGMGIIYGRAGNKTEAHKVINALLRKQSTQYVTPMDIALVYSTMNERDKAIEWLEKALIERSAWLFEIRVDPVLEPIRSDPRFQDIVRRVGV